MPDNEAILLTPPGAAAIAVVRLRGPMVRDFLAKHFSAGVPSPMRCRHGELKDENGQVIRTGERMWVIVAERIGDIFIGILNSLPACMTPDDPAYLRFGAEIPFVTGNEFFALLLAQVILVLGCIMRGL